MKRGRVESNPGKGYTIVSGGGEFKEGAHFMMGHFEYTLKMGNWPEGMVVRKDGKRYVVVRIVNYELRELPHRSLREVEDFQRR